MPGPITIHDGELAVKDPADISVYVFDWDAEHLATGVTIAPGTSVFTITSIPSGDTLLTKDQESILAGNRKTQLRLTAGTSGMQYRIDNKVVTSETPAQTKERSFFVLVQDK